MSGSNSGSDLFLDESESWSSVLETNEDDDLKILLSILGATGFFICLYSIRYWCDKKRQDL